MVGQVHSHHVFFFLEKFQQICLADHSRRFRFFSLKFLSVTEKRCRVIFRIFLGHGCVVQQFVEELESVASDQEVSAAFNAE